MKTLLGFGTAGCNIVSRFKKYDQYRIYTINSSEKKSSKYNLSIERLESPEDYEALDTRKLDKFLGNIEGTLEVMVSGASLVTGLLLKALQPLYDRGVKIRICYFEPETDLLTGQEQLHERVVRNVLQQYARSGVFSDIYMISNRCLEALAGETSVLNYYQKLNDVFVDSYYMLDVFKNTKPVTSTFSKGRESCRIKTIGVSSVLDSEHLFYPIDRPREILYYFGISSDKLMKEGSLLKDITSKIKEKMSEDVKVSFSIYPTQYESDYIYVEYTTSDIQ